MPPKDDEHKPNPNEPPPKPGRAGTPDDAPRGAPLEDEKGPITPERAKQQEADEKERRYRAGTMSASEREKYEKEKSQPHEKEKSEKPKP